MEKKKKILIIRLGAIGDVVHTTIMADAIKRKHPNYEIHYLTQSEIAPILKNNKNIDNIILWDRENRKSHKQFFKIGLTLFKEHYDIVYNLTLSLRNILLSIMTCAPKIITKQKKGGLWVHDYFYTAKKGIKDIESPERLFLGVDPDSDEKIKRYLSDKKRPYVVMIPGGATNNNRQGRLWNIDKWQSLSEKIINEYGGSIIVSGTLQERKHHKQLENNSIYISSGYFNIAESSALYSHADLMISGDTGPIHIASGHNIKTLALLGSTSPEQIKPYGENGHYISSNDECKYCWKKKCHKINGDTKYTPCMEHITPDMVMSKIKDENLL